MKNGTETNNDSSPDSSLNRLNSLGLCISSTLYSTLFLYFFKTHFAEHSNAFRCSDISDGESLVEVEVGDD